MVLPIMHDAAFADRDDKPFIGGIKLMYYFIFTAIPETTCGIASAILIVRTF